MPLAARFFDFSMAAHAGFITWPCSPDVFIGGRPAARMSHPFLCGLAPPAGPHFSNFIIDGSSTVHINHHPATRVGDALMCGSTVFTGCPTVEIGGPPHGATSITIGNLTIKGSPAFVRATLMDLARLLLTADGRTIVFQLGKTTIVEFTGPNSYAVPLDMNGAYGGSGSEVMIGFNPNLTLTVPATGTASATAPTPSSIVLGHELVHGRHMNNGTTNNNDEQATMGTGPFAASSPTENSLRRQFDPAGTTLGQRTSHAGVTGRKPGVPPGPVQ